MTLDAELWILCSVFLCLFDACPTHLMYDVVYNVQYCRELGECQRHHQTAPELASLKLKWHWGFNARASSNYLCALFVPSPCSCFIALGPLTEPRLVLGNNSSNCHWTQLCANAWSSIFHVTKSLGGGGSQLTLALNVATAVRNISVWLFSIEKHFQHSLEEVFMGIVEWTIRL